MIEILGNLSVGTDAHLSQERIMTTPTLSARRGHATSPTTGDGVDPGSVAGFMQAFNAAQMRAEALLKIVAGDHGIGVSDLRALYFVHAGTDVTPRDLAAYLDLSSGSVTSVIDRMTDAGHLARVAHPTDRRSSLLEMAPAGVSLIEAEIGFYLGVFDGVAPSPELAVVTAALEELAGSMTRQSVRRSAGDVG
jgi:DNA-binding MarR family transcriptional regulator